MKHVFLILIVAIALFSIQPINAMTKSLIAKSNSPLIVKLIDKNIWKLTPDNGDSILLYQSKADFIDKSSLSVSPQNSYYAVIEQIFGKYITKESELKCRYDVLPRVVLTIYNKNGHRVDSVMDVFAYVWDYKGSRIAFTTCDFSYAEYIESHPTGLWILNIGTGKPIKIANHAENLFWAKHDGCLYYTAYTSKGDLVYKWNPVDSSIEVTNHQDVYFSPDGKYYLSLYKEDDWGKPIQLYDSKTDKRLFVITSYEENLSPESDTFPFPSGIGNLWCTLDTKIPFSWVSTQDHYLLFIKPDLGNGNSNSDRGNSGEQPPIYSQQNYIFDVEKRKVVKQFDGIIGSWVGNGDQIIIERNGKIELEDIPE